MKQLNMSFTIAMLASIALPLSFTHAKAASISDLPKGTRIEFKNVYIDLSSGDGTAGITQSQVDHPTDIVNLQVGYIPGVGSVLSQCTFDCSDRSGSSGSSGCYHYPFADDRFVSDFIFTVNSVVSGTEINQNGTPVDGSTLNYFLVEGTPGFSDAFVPQANDNAWKVDEITCYTSEIESAAIHDQLMRATIGRVS